MRFLKRLTIRLRWPAAVLVGLLTLGFVCSAFWGCRVDLSFLGSWWILDLGNTIATLTQYDSQLDPGRPSPDLVVTGYSVKWYPIEDFDLFLNAWVRKGSWPGVDWVARLPLWYLALPPALLAIAGFVMKRREPKPGQCQHCRHPLAGAVVCPECGTRPLAAS
ncbi:MAG: hypothetical protein U0625_06805 [Phycisphaerales bacterium]